MKKMYCYRLKLREGGPGYGFAHDSMEVVATGIAQAFEHAQKNMCALYGWTSAVLLSAESTGYPVQHAPKR